MSDYYPPGVTQSMIDDLFPDEMPEDVYQYVVELEKEREELDRRIEVASASEDLDPIPLQNRWREVNDEIIRLYESYGQEPL